MVSVCTHRQCHNGRHSELEYYKSPFSKKKVLELRPHFSPTVGFAVIDKSGRPYTISEEQFTDRFYAELISEVTGFSEYIRMRNKKYNGN